MARKTKQGRGYVAYYRVSTQRQGRSGLGLDAQREAVEAYVARDGDAVVAEFTETESGGRADRPMLAKALAACRLHGAVLIIAKLDRLARNVAFISNLMESGVEFVAVDFPQANRLTVHMLAAVAEHEREMISQRTSAALGAIRAKIRREGHHVSRSGRVIDRLGNDNLTDGARRLGTAASARIRAERAASRAADVMPTIRDLRDRGTTSLRGIAAALNDMGVPSPRGGRWYPSSVRNVLAQGQQV